MLFRISHLAAARAPAGWERIAGSDSVCACLIRLALSYKGQWRSTWQTVWACHPQVHAGRMSGTLTEDSQALRPMTSVRSRNKAVASAFVRPSYSFATLLLHGVCQVE